jgi:siroheme synthase
VLISRATSKDEKIFRTTVGELPTRAAAASPSLVIVGAVVGATLAKETDASEGELSPELCAEILSLALQHPYPDSVRGSGVE